MVAEVREIQKNEGDSLRRKGSGAEFEVIMWKTWDWLLRAEDNSNLILLKESLFANNSNEVGSEFLPRALNACWLAAALILALWDLTENLDLQKFWATESWANKCVNFKQLSLWSLAMQQWKIHTFYVPI